MLSNDTKLKRINEKLKQYGLEMQWGCYDLKSYTPRLLQLYAEPLLYKTYILYGIKLDVKVVAQNRVKFCVQKINGIDSSKQTGDWFELYVKYVKDIDSVINYCNSLSLEVPKYHG